MSELLFDSEWLTLRRRADHQARDTLLNEEANYWLTTRQRSHIVDLGAGNGNNAHYLIPWLGPQQHWRLIDHDAGLLKDARRGLEELIQTHHPDAGHCIETGEMDLNALDLPSLHQQWPIDLVTASALLDLASESWIEGLVGQCQRIQAAVLLVLNVNGHWSITGIKDPLDETIRQAVNTHQTKSKGWGQGAALGPMAAFNAVDQFKAAGFEVQTRTSVWQLLAGSAYTKALGFQLINGWHQAACEMLPDQTHEFDVWFVRRQTQLNTGQVGIEVGHTDIYAEPLAS